MTAIRASWPPLSGDEVLEDGRLAQLVLGTADDHEWSAGHDSAG